MQHTLWKIISKPNDYKICMNCWALNRYENEVCHECNYEKIGKKFTEHWGTEVKQRIIREEIRLDSDENQGELKYTLDTFYNV